MEKYKNFIVRQFLKKIYLYKEIIKEELDLGHQAYIVLPLVEESDKLELRSAIDVYQELSNIVFNWNCNFFVFKEFVLL